MTFALLVALAALAPPIALQDYKPLLGAFRCTGTQREGPGARATATAGTWSFAADLDGFWISARFTHERTGADPQPHKGAGHLGYDEEQARFVAAFVTNDGQAEQESSGGWDGPRLVFQGQLRDGDDRIPFRRTFERVEPIRGATAHRLRVSYELQLTDGAWTLVTEETCTRS